jgi:hypothetical protein
MKKALLKTLLSLLLIVWIHVDLLAQEVDRHIGIAMYLKPIPGMAYEFDQALGHYNKTYRTDPKYAVRVIQIVGGPRSGSLLIVEPPKTWTEMDEARPYQSDASARAWQNVLKHCSETQIVYFSLDTKRANPLTNIQPTTKFIGYFWELDPKANEEAFAAEFYKAADLLKKAGYHFTITRSLSGNTTYQIQMQYENGWKDMDKNLPSYKELFVKAYPGKGEWEKHSGILSAGTKEAYTEFRTIRNALSTR